MLQNKIYQSFAIEIIKTFLTILFALSLIALTVRAVNFLDLMVENGYPIFTYFKYSFLNVFGIIPKFIPLSFLLSLTIFILKHSQENEFILLWTSGVKKTTLVNVFFYISLIVLLIYLTFTILVTPFALNKSRNLLVNENLNSILPTIKTQQFSDAFKGLTFIVEKKVDNEIKNIFLHDKNNNLSNLSSNSSEISSTTIIAENGVVQKKRMILLNGQIISTKKNLKNEIIFFDKLNINLDNLSTTTIKKPKIQELSTFLLFKCFSKNEYLYEFCNKEFKKEILSNLNRRIGIPFYIPVISFICALLLIKTNKFLLNKPNIFLYNFVILLFTEIVVRYTGMYKILSLVFIILPFILLILIYLFLNYSFSKEVKKYE